MNDDGAEKAKHLFCRGLAQLGIALPDKTVNGLVRYSLELIKWNRKVNLVAKNTSLEDVVEKHFLDSLTLVSVLAAHVPEDGTLLDVGTGAGFPGLVVKAACPKRPVTLLEPRQRRVSFLNHIIRLLSLSGVEVLPHRTDDDQMPPDVRYSVITSRAVADVSSFLEMVRELAGPGTLVVCMQGSSGKEQWERAKNNPRFSRIGIEHIQLPFSHAHRAILLFRKES